MHFMLPNIRPWDQRSHYAPTGASNIVNQYSPAACVHVKQSHCVARKACCNKTQSVHVDDIFLLIEECLFAVSERQRRVDPAVRESEVSLLQQDSVYARC